MTDEKMRKALEQSNAALSALLDRLRIDDATWCIVQDWSEYNEGCSAWFKARGPLSTKQKKENEPVADSKEMLDARFPHALVERLIHISKRVTVIHSSKIIMALDDAAAEIKSLYVALADKQEKEGSVASVQDELFSSEILRFRVLEEAAKVADRYYENAERIKRESIACGSVPAFNDATSRMADASACARDIRALKVKSVT